MEDLKIKVFFDYTCPWVRQAGKWLHDVQNELGSKLVIEWKCFLLEQVNSRDTGWKAWEQGPDYISRGIWPHRGGVAARMQGDYAHWLYAETIFEAKHVQRLDIRSRENILHLVEGTDIDMVRFKQELDSNDCMEQIVADHMEAEALSIFGTPTILPEGEMPVFLKTFTPPKEKAVSVFEHIISLSKQPYFGELKRPQPPWPQGVDA